jgi:glutathione synthase/RimK-type ligase-like ATP-grasp enzyme
VQLRVWRQIYEERLYVISKVLRKTLFPTFEELWLWESKRRMHYWLEANQIPHAKTWLFYDLSQAMSFAQDVKLPIVYKSDLGSGSSGVIVFRDGRRLRKHIKLCFERGFTTYRRSPQDTEWRYVLLQEYLSEAHEWRIIRVGDSFFGYEKVKRGEFHSGSRRWRYGRPPSDLLDFVKVITDTNGFRSMDIDIFVAKGNQYFVNELQAIFGITNSRDLCIVNGKVGRMLHDGTTDKWVFEEGSFCQNYLCNLRVQTLLAKLET